MSRDNATPADEGRKPQARRLTEQAIEAERRGDEAAADRLFAEAERIDPDTVIAVLDEQIAAAPEAARLRSVQRRETSDTPKAPASTGLGHAQGTTQAPRSAPAHPTTRAINLL